MNKKKVILSISGHDPSGGAGLQTDILISKLFNFHCVSCLTCQTIQTTEKLFKVTSTDKKFFKESLKHLKKSTDISGIKVGAIPNKDIALEIINIFSSLDVPIVIDPIIYAGGGGKFLNKNDLMFCRDLFYPHSDLLTPNHKELKLLSSNKSEKDSVKFLYDKGIENIYVTGRLNKGTILNSLYSKGTLIDETTSNYLNKDFHGTGCAISTAILCNLVNKKKLKDACSNSHKFLSKLVQDSFETSGQDILNFKK